MLLSPGHSPRHLSTPSPAPSISSDPNPNPDSSLVSTSAPDLSTHKRRRSPTVLDEDSYVAAIEKIIERDFFPDIPKLRDRLDWLQAVRTHDPVLIRDAQLKILERRRQRKAGDSVADASFRSTTVTPGSSFFRNTSVTPSLYSEHKDNPSSDNLDGDGDGGEEQVDVSLSLDVFFRKYTSEDNESFSRIMEKVNRKRKEKHGYLLECGGTEGNGGNNLIENGTKREKIATDGYGTSDQPLSTLEGWKYTPKNLLMYHPADRGEAPLTAEERALRLKGLTKEISKSNTRFHAKAMEVDALKDDDTAEVLYTPVAGATPVVISNRNGDKVKRYDLEDLRKTPNRFYVESEKKADNGYSFVKTPSPAPGVDESPFITWGEIEGTPLRLEPEETPIDIGGSGDGPQFKIPKPPSRDVKAHSLSREAARKIRERSKMFQKPPLPSPVRGGSASPSTRTLSPAARKFMRNAIAKSSQSIDESLRASYCSASPGLGMPKSGRSVSRLGRDGSMGSRSPSLREGSNPCW
ncbi:Nuclear protein ES2 [Handroanthus impetiginosus]|uniref:Nuclear protein ES2 n=1 Tax=Handroanthus impetiginosus TaxID=429701 RepID=A0A2G9I6F6_9LAMI|nr:Nuclear protein ES2 [Handroanthus impetiginosus]